ncbi:hypothetical protein SDC9_204556 [bioreactor metagenome]|uniref:Uncharacterized protein n=1 Tax=bioreactor metagenome TaxID=1076179 RepID=A0A645JBE9_9ZZZZ
MAGNDQVEAADGKHFLHHRLEGGDGENTLLHLGATGSHHQHAQSGTADVVHRRKIEE